MEVAYVKTWTTRAWFVTRMLALLAAVAVGLVLLGRDGRPVSASHTEIFFSLSPTTSSATPAGTLVFYPNSAPVTVYVHARNVTHDPTGVAAFEIKFTFNQDLVSVTSLQQSSTWLGSTGRSPTCTSPIVGPDISGLYRADVGCYTAGTSPFGPQGGGLLGSFVLAPGTITGSSSLVNRSFLLNTTADALEITALKRNVSAVVAECADFNNDHVVSASDIGLVVQHFGTVGGPPPSQNWDPRYDMNNDNAIGAADIGLTVIQFGRQCTA